MSKDFWEVPIEIKFWPIKKPDIRREQWYELLAEVLVTFLLFIVRRK